MRKNDVNKLNLQDFEFSASNKSLILEILRHYSINLKKLNVYPWLHHPPQPIVKLIPLHEAQVYSGDIKCFCLCDILFHRHHFSTLSVENPLSINNPIVWVFV